MIRTCLAVLTLLLSLCAPASAQTFPPGAFTIGGYPAGCGAMVWTEVSGGIGDMARAVPATGGMPPRILLDPAFFAQPQPVQFFIYAHECGHHVVGFNENMADCWAAKLGRGQGWFTPVTMQFLVATFQWSPGDWTHAPGPVRLNNIASCWSSP
jgi:hypothetical protein